MKKNSLILCVIFAITSTKCFSQEDKGIFSLSVGASYPTGDFASKNLNNNSAGYATTGFLIDLNYKYGFNEHFGFTAMVRVLSNGFDDKSIVTEFERQSPGVLAYVTSKSYTMTGSMIGAFGSFKLNEKFNLVPKVMLGFLTASSPELNIIIYGPGGSGMIKQQSVSSTALSYLVGVTLQSNYSKRICFMSNIDYLGSKPEFNNVLITSSDGFSGRSSFSQSLGTINISVGVGYRLYYDK